MTTDLVYKSFELIADKGDDITPLVYERFFAKSPDAVGVMGHIDDIVRGRMMEEVYRVLMSGDLAGEQGYLDWEVTNHRSAYNVAIGMYPVLLDALMEVVREVVDAEWSDDFEDAWQVRCEALLDEINRRYAH